MYLKILSLKNVEYEGEVVSLNVKTQSGEITILDNHRPLISVLKKGLAVITDEKNNQKELEIESGFLEMTDGNKLNLLID